MPLLQWPCLLIIQTKKSKKEQNNKKEQVKKETREQKDVNLKRTQSQVGLQEEPSGSTQNKKEVKQGKKESDKSLGPQSFPLLLLVPLLVLLLCCAAGCCFVRQRLG